MEEKRKCPKCKTGHLEERVRRPVIVKTLLFWLPIKRYRCFDCDRKSYILGS
jgi:transposase-like protein